MIVTIKQVTELRLSNEEADSLIDALLALRTNRYIQTSRYGTVVGEREVAGIKLIIEKKQV